MIEERGAVGEGTCVRCDRHGMIPKVCDPAAYAGCPVTAHAASEARDRARRGE